MMARAFKFLPSVYSNALPAKGILGLLNRVPLGPACLRSNTNTEIARK